MLIGQWGEQSCKKLAGFNPLVKTKSGLKIPKNASDWVFWSDEVPAKVRDLHEEGYHIAIFSNQFVIWNKPDKQAELKLKLCQIQSELGVPLTFLAAMGPGKDSFRKPNRTMYDYLEKNLNGGVKFTKKQSFFCGVHAGR